MPLLKEQCQVILKPLNNYNIQAALKLELAVFFKWEGFILIKNTLIPIFKVLRNVTSSSYLHLLCFLGFGGEQSILGFSV